MTGRGLVAAGPRLLCGRSYGMSDETIGMIHEDTLPGHEMDLEPKPAW